MSRRQDRKQHVGRRFFRWLFRWRYYGCGVGKRRQEREVQRLHAAGRVGGLQADDVIKIRMMLLLYS